METVIGGFALLGVVFTGLVVLFSGMCIVWIVASFVNKLVEWVVSDHESTSITLKTIVTKEDIENLNIEVSKLEKVANSSSKNRYLKTGYKDAYINTEADNKIWNGIETIVREDK